MSPLHYPPPQHPVDSPQVQSWSGRSQYRRNSAGHPSGLRWLSYMPQSDSVRNKENCHEIVKREPWDSSFSFPWLQTGKHRTISGKYKKSPKGISKWNLPMKKCLLMVHLWARSSKKHLLNTYYVTGTVVGARIQKIGPDLSLLQLLVLWEKTTELVSGDLVSIKILETVWLSDK